MSTLKIYNKNTQNEITIDDTVDWVTITPMTNVEPKHFRIELKGFFFGNHTRSCEDCKSFFNSFGNDKNEWFIQYNSKRYKILMDSLGDGNFGDNQIKQSISEFEYGTNMVLKVIELNKSELESQLSEAIKNEDYEKACIYRDLVSEIKN